MRDKETVFLARLFVFCATIARASTDMYAKRTRKQASRGRVLMRRRKGKAPPEIDNWSCFARISRYGSPGTRRFLQLANDREKETPTLAQGCFLL